MSAVVDHLLHLIRVQSVSNMSNAGVIEYASEVLHAAGWTMSRQMYVDPAGVEKFNLVAAPQGEDVSVRDVELAFVCHTDTVPYAAEWAEAVLPFVADDTVYGCGACDVKGFLACLLAAAEVCADGSLRSGLRIVLTADEEVGCIGAARLLASNVIAPKRIVIGEPTSLHPARAGKGYCLAEVTVWGAEAHSAHPKQGRSAIYDAAALIAELERLGEQMALERDEFFEPPFATLNIGVLHGGSAKNIVPGSCRFLLEWRPIPGQDVDAVPDALRGICQRLAEIRPGFRYEMKVLRQQAGFETSSEAWLTQRIQTLTQRSAVAIPFGSEANVFGAVAEEIVVFGPGDMRTAHSSRECVAIAELNEAVVCLQSMMRIG